MTLAARFFGALGAPLVHLTRQSVGLYLIAWHTLAALVRFRYSGREALKQCYLIGNRSLLFITVTLGFLGVISVYQTALQVQQIIPDFTMLGPAFLQMLTREFGPTICGLMIATRVGSGIAAEIGSMVVTEQVDALRMCNADPVEYLIVPRTIASATMLTLLSVYAILVAFASGSVVGHVAFGINYQTFWSFQLVDGADILTGLTKAFAYGTAIPIIAGHSGLETTGGSEGVGWATTRAVVNTSFAVIVLDFVISTLAYLLTGGQ